MALPALTTLLEQGKVAGVGMPDKQNEMRTVVEMLCSRYRVPLRLFQKATLPVDLSEWISACAPDAVLVKTFPWKIPAEILDMPKHGFINFHYAPLPQYRGPNPLFWMIRDGAKEAGITVHRMTAEFDEGPILFTSTIPIHPGVTFGMLCTQLGYSGLDLTGKLLEAMQAGDLGGTIQPEENTGWYRRPEPEDMQISWKEMDAAAIMRLVNACNPWNKGTPVKLNGWTIGLTHVTPFLQNGEADVTPGTVLALNNEHGLCIACAGKTAVRADVIYTEEGFLPGFALAGFGIAPGMRFG
jgi:methionyl-tRNA formyltransferase